MAWLRGTAAALGHYFAYRQNWLRYGSDMSANFYGAICAWIACFVVTAVVSAGTSRKPEQELRGLVYSRTDGHGGVRKTWIFAALIAMALVALNVIFY